jgi:hypothetical protein
MYYTGRQSRLGPRSLSHGRRLFECSSVYSCKLKHVRKICTSSTHRSFTNLRLQTLGYALVVGPVTLLTKLRSVGTNTLMKSQIARFPAETHADSAHMSILTSHLTLGHRKYRPHRKRTMSRRWYAKSRWPQ